MHKTIKWGLYSLLAFTSWHYLSLFCKTQTDGFSVAKIQSNLPFDPKWEIRASSETTQKELQQILSQPFQYLGRGGQCFAFISEDQQYVIKFFNHHFYKPYEILLQLPLPHILHQICYKNLHRVLSKIDKDYTSYKIAYEEIPHQTGLIYIQLQPQEEFTQSVCILDKLNTPHTLPLNKIPFILQKRAEPVPVYLKKLKKTGDRMASREAIHTLVETLNFCLQKGIVDTDPGLHRNFGFIGNKPMFIDVGKFKYSTADSEQDLKKITTRFRFFLESKYPELVPILDEEIDAITTNTNS